MDDGSFETNLGATGGGTFFRVNRLTPASYPATLNAVTIFFGSSSNLPANAPVTVVYGASPGGGENINGVTLQRLNATVQTLGQFNVFTTPGLTINSGDFVVGLCITSADGTFPLSIDTTPPSRRRSYRTPDSGAIFQIVDDVQGQLSESPKVC